ncbi:MAG: putative rane protein [Actinomycetia bacterium]|nr:putative rane protein [Actinomycetes bacterium]
MLEERRHSPGTGPADAAPDDTASAKAVPENRAMNEDTAPREDKLVPDKATSPAALRVWRDPWTWGIAALVFGAYLVISLYRLWTLTPSSWDLGIYTEYVKQWADLHPPIVDVRGPAFNLLGDHFQVIVALIAPFFRLFPTPATLLVVQALLTALSVFPVVQAGNALLGPDAAGRARAIGFAYGFSWGLQQMVDFDFHEIAFAVPLLAFSLSALVRGRVRATVCWALPMVLVKEDQGFTIAVIGILMWLASVRGWKRLAASAPAGLFLACWGVGCSLIEISWIIPHFNATHRYAYWDLGGVVGGGPGFSVGGLLAQLGQAYPVKLQTLALLLLPTAFIALGSPVAAVVIPSILLRFIATNPYYWGTMWHYNATAMPILFIAAIEAMACWRQAGAGGRRAGGDEAAAGGRRAGGDEAGAELSAAGWAGAVRDKWRTVTAAAGRHGAAMMAALAVALAFQFPLSHLWNGQTYEIGPNVAADQAAMAVVPNGATVTTTLNLLAPLAARCDTFWVGNSGNPDTQYVVFDGPNSGYSPAVTDVPSFIKQLYPGAAYQQVFQDDGVYVFKLR